MARIRPVPGLAAGPYRTPRAKPGQSVLCQRRGPAQIDGFTEGTQATEDGIPLSWPYVIVGNKRSLLVFGDLARAVKAESEKHVAQCWGVSTTVVKRWRRLLGVRRMTPGTLLLWSQLTTTRLTAESRLKGSHAAGRVVAKLSTTDVRRIRKLHHQGRPATEIAAQYRVCPETVRRIALRRSWKDVD